MTKHDILTLAVGINLGTLLCLVVHFGNDLLNVRRDRRRVAARRAEAAPREQA
ncbi:hypothetical protein ACIBKZ_18000 [Streptomyces sp. NPDC050421]|uniref:hypothetical protein n=1 Tax=Streptomyces sp. NPDC050421 TaxID=3365613 RepID=UPI0037B1C60C